MDLFNEQTDWATALKPLIAKYKNKQHPLEYKNLYQLLVMVVLSAQDSDAHINKIAPNLFQAFPNMKSLAQADEKSLLPYIEEVRFHGNKIKWLLEIADSIKQDKNIPATMKELTALKGIGRKSANVIMREAGVPAEGIMADLHVVRVAPRLGIAKGKDADKIEKEMMEILPKSMWSEVGMAISFLGRETCRPSNPKHSECLMNSVCEFYKNKKSGN
ncbi:MAG: DNA lyase [Flavobacterium sp. 38-13]|uniref:endonuclease III domain-containing protein n=1 Tax=Flavobacterium sp. 38-13 TaxID=1896168 RepID=UPI00095AA3A3|nr:endonuclease III [Flavobacterium sp. 38-13]OJX53418.1 MAG: DNA lyase [Flavobacterium sp. 38-13]